MKTPRPHELLKAEKQVLTGVYVRLYRRYVGRFPEEKARALAGAVTHRIFNLEPADVSAAEFLKDHDDIIKEEIGMLGGDQEIRRAISDTMVLKVVFMQRQAGCRDGVSTGPVDHLKGLGLFLEAEKAPTPSSFVQTAKEFYDATPW